MAEQGREVQPAYEIRQMHQMHRMHQIAAALIRRGDEVLLVREQGPHEARSAWALPGGVVEPGELLAEALVREVREETGLAVAELGPLLYLTDHENPGIGLAFDGAPDGPGFHATAAIFAVARWEGELHSDDPGRADPRRGLLPGRRGARPTGPAALSGDARAARRVSLRRGARGDRVVLPASARRRGCAGGTDRWGRLDITAAGVTCLRAAAGARKETWAARQETI